MRTSAGLLKKLAIQPTKEKAMYSVSINNTWSNDGKATKAFFESKGCNVKKSRLYGDFDVFLNHIKIATIFKSKEDQMDFLILKGLV